ncbi:monocarboxylate transporter 13-like isoform X3 [Amphiura filiformis]|uniref:monocarboxylate transporter 13-like isoform X3 n=1 Tax=Amphiura filiformis TaxID=82378 RepID=UPI003B2155EA
MAKNSSKFRGFGVILSGFITRVLIVGLYSSLGLFFIEWNEYFSASATKISLVGSVFIGILWSSSLLGSSLSHRLSFRTITIVGGLIAACSFTITSLLVDSLDYIIATFVVAGVGLGIAYLSAQAVLLFNFDKHLGKATSLANCGSGVGMFIIPLSFRYLLDEFGWRGCLFIAAGYLVDLTGSYRASLTTAGGFGLLAAMILFTEPRLQHLYESYCRRRDVVQGGSGFRHEQIKHNVLHFKQDCKKGQGADIKAITEMISSV